jgi:NAD(P)-dependent dehydrogenase (short-subunit alcohol dehydrogenase family)
VALVQGASRGLGLEFVKQLLAAEAPGGRGGGTVVATCRTPSQAEELQSLMTQHPGRLHVLALDVTQQDTIDVRA